MSSSRYSLPAIALHWFMALLIIGTFCVGLFMTELRLSPLKLKIYSWHKWAGVTVLWLAFFRLAWRAYQKPPELPESMPTWQRKVALNIHYVLYILMFAIPLSGWLMSSAKGFKVVYFGIWPLPNLINKNKYLGDILKEVHEWLNYTMITLVAGHAMAALRHHFVDRDDILTRMIPCLRVRTSIVEKERTN